MANASAEIITHLRSNRLCTCSHPVPLRPAGESLVIIRRRKPVARLVPVEPGKRVLTPEQQAARQRALERMRRGIKICGARFNREELYER